MPIHNPLPEVWVYKKSVSLWTGDQEWILETHKHVSIPNYEKLTLSRSPTGKVTDEEVVYEWFDTSQVDPQDLVSKQIED
jgi:hypothetical protein